MNKQSKRQAAECSLTMNRRRFLTCSTYLGAASLLVMHTKYSNISTESKNSIVNLKPYIWAL